MIYRVCHKTTISDLEISPVASKSESNRALLIRALSGEKFRITNLSEADDTRILETILSSIVLKSSSGIQVIDAGNAGTVYRFLTAFLAMSKGEWLISGSPRMKERPVKILVDALKELGAEISYTEKEGFPPLLIKGKKLIGKKLTVDAGMSSQYISALLMIAPRLQNGLILDLKGEVASEPYIGMTLKIMEHFGVRSQRNANTILVNEQFYKHVEYAVEADWSAAAYWYEMMALSLSSEISLPGYRENSFQGDRHILHFMKNFGVETLFTEKGILLRKSFPSPPGSENEFHLFDFPDLAPSLISTCCALNKGGIFKGIRNLVIKESNRTEALMNELKKFGFDISNPDTDTIIVRPTSSLSQRTNKTIRIKTYGDHRIAMAMAPLSLLGDAIEIEDPEVVAKSYPSFWKDLQKAGFGITQV